MDQAEGLRRRINSSNMELGGRSDLHQPRKRVRTIAITSGKGGVGKTSISANLAYLLAKEGKKTLIIDADTGLANVDVVLGLTPKYNIQHVLTGESTLEETVITGPGGIYILPAASGVLEMTDLSRGQKLTLLDCVRDWREDLEYLLIDTAAGISGNVMYFNMVAREIVVIVSPDPTSLTDAYALMKVLYKHHGKKRFKIIVNMAKNEDEAKDVFKRISLATDHFLNLTIDYLGFVVRDDGVTRSIRRQKVIAELYPQAPASKCLGDIARTILEETDNQEESISGFFIK